ncbi:E3 ubiquitin-protein ligase [Podospora aff. communis PSN243]|uniref:RING-type E3 ubiquitin transferase n=1 Tax=Podospora aff. communis PSN243 TaxID=3040156 RepID=A0AAV9GFZ3_9PEZI|nr:E3 ubiquitin-protein ligase [Podospora aff. communis PSN243]
MPEEAADTEIQAKVLQTTLAEISSTRQNGVNNSNKAEDAPPPPVDCCVICLDTISEPCAALPCAHAHFDLLCLLSWVQERATCPLCNAPISKLEYNDKAGKRHTYPVEPGPGTTSERHEIDSVQRRRRRRRSPELFRGSDGLLTRPASDIERRRHVYRHQLYSLHVGSNRVSQYRLPPTPNDFRSNPHLVSRARLWIRRELQVFTFLSDAPEESSGTQQGSSSQQPQAKSRKRDNAEFLLEYIVAVVKTVDLQDSAGQAEDLLSNFLGRDDARLFLHELRNWLRSPCQSLAVWDREVQYPDRRRSYTPPNDAENEEEWPRQRPEEDGSRSWRDEMGGDHWRPSTSSRKRRHSGRDTDYPREGTIDFRRGVRGGKD